MPSSPVAESAPAPAPVAFKKRGARPKTTSRKRDKPEPASDSDSSGDDLAQRKTKRRQQPDAATKNTEQFRTVFEAERNLDLAATNDATKQRTKIGPTHTATNVRTTTMMDYAPDVCKDVRSPSLSPTFRLPSASADTSATRKILTPPTVQADGLLRLRRQLQVPPRPLRLQARLAARQGLGNRLQRKAQPRRHRHRQREPRQGRRGG
ncbi:hypothetical protein IMZ48_18000 [Candidatus Bathyarchaeota archaeon]|nr:hypothetical protein [Candidatus Bathyarchaeota archaeon]